MSDQTYAHEKLQELGAELFRRWMHWHYVDEIAWEENHFDWCCECRNNFAKAVENGDACKLHPSAAFNPRAGICDGCDEDQWEKEGAK